MPALPAMGPQALGLLILETPAGRRKAAPVQLRGVGSLPLRSGGSLQKKGLTAGFADEPGAPAEIGASHYPPVSVRAHRQAGLRTGSGFQMP